MTRAAAPRDRDHDDRAPIPPPIPRRRWVLLLILLVAPVLLAEVVVQGLIATNRLAPATAHERSLENKWLNLRRAGPLDIVLLGPSTMNSGVEPAVLAKLVGSDLGVEVDVFNLGIPGLGSDPAIARRLDPEGRLPAIAVIGLSPGGLGGEGMGVAAFRPFRQSPMGQLFSGCEGYVDRGYEEYIDCAAGVYSAFWRWRGRLDEVIRSIRGAAVRFGDRRDRRTDGFTAGVPRTIAQIESQIEEGLSRESPTVQLGEGSVERFRQIAAFFKDHDIPLVGVLIPYAPPYMAAVEARYPGFTASWQRATQELSERAGFPVVDTAAFGDWWGDGSSQNIKHLSVEGAVDFTHQLWETPAFRDAVLEALGGAAASPRPMPADETAPPASPAAPSASAG